MIDDIYHENVRYLGNLLGEIIKEQEGEKTFNLIEKDGKKKIVGVIFDGSRNMELLIKKVK